MKLDTLLLFFGMVHILSKYGMECYEKTIRPNRNTRVAVDQMFSLIVATLTDAPDSFTISWKVTIDGKEIPIQNSSVSDDVSVTIEEGPGTEGFIWKNTTLVGSFSHERHVVFICYRNDEQILASVQVQGNSTITTPTTTTTTTTTLFGEITTPPATPEDSNSNDNKMPPKPHGLVVTNAKQGELRLDWSVRPTRGPHCLTYFNISYKLWPNGFTKISTLPWVHLEQKDVGIQNTAAGSYSYTLEGMPLNYFVKLYIRSFCISNGNTKYRVSDPFLVLEHTPARIYGLPEYRNVTEGDSFSLTCDAVGFPVPTFVWSTDNPLPNILSDESNIDGKSLIFNAVSMDDQGTYYCTTSNSPNGTHASDKRAVFLNVNPSYPTSPPLGNCAIVILNDCSPYLNEAPGYLLSAELEGLATELKNYLLSITSSSEWHPCYQAGMKYFCNNMFRPCDVTRQPVQTVSASNDFCYQDCIDFWFSDCVEFWKQFQTSELYGRYPWIHECENITSSEQTCTPLGIKSIIVRTYGLTFIPSTTAVTKATSQGVDSTTLPLIIGIVVIFFIIIIIAIGIIVLCVLYYRQFNKPQFCSSRFIDSKVAENQFYSPFNNKANLTDKKEFPRPSVRFIRKLGQGQFGAVDLAEASSIIPGEKVTLVAVKTLHEGATVKNRMDFEREADIMLRFDHANILQLLGVSFKDKSAPLCLIFEYMENGDLNNYLRGCASSFMKRTKKITPSSRTESDLSDDPPILSTVDLVNISSQISGGMHYLSVRSFVHRDLATRNCLVGKNLVVKIGDFGMSKDVYKSDYYRIGKEALLPIKWMAPEAIMYGKATIQTDIWSFGVLMWEVFSFAMQPWYGFTNEQVMEKVKGGEILSRPDNCPQMTYSLMLECWDMEPSKRITFESILQRLNSWRVSSTESTSLPDIPLEAPDPFDDEITGSI